MPCSGAQPCLSWPCPQTGQEWLSKTTPALFLVSVPTSPPYLPLANLRRRDGRPLHSHFRDGNRCRGAEKLPTGVLQLPLGGQNWDQKTLPPQFLFLIKILSLSWNIAGEDNVVIVSGGQQGNSVTHTCARFSPEPLASVLPRGVEQRPCTAGRSLQCTLIEFCR